jgi:hypothetical protein
VAKVAAAVSDETNDAMLERLSECDRRYYEGSEEPISERLFEWIRRNSERILLPKKL